MIRGQLSLLDLLPDVAGERAERRTDGLVCLRDEVPTALEAICGLSFGRTIDDTGVSISAGRFAYVVCHAGVRYERKNEWRGGRPAHLLPWGELAEHVGGDPRRTGLVAWAESLPEPRWQELYRPYELWPYPERWHPSYISADRERPGWADRNAAWATARAILTDAIGREGT